MRLRLIALTLTVIALSPLLGAAGARAAGGSPPTAQTCTGLVGQTFPASSTDSAQVTGATDQAAANGNPEYCDVTGQIGGRINFDERLPLSTWNNQYVQVGNGGFCGSIPTVQGSGDGYMQAGAAVASDDSGHTGTPFDASFGGNNQARYDWAYLAEHLLAVSAKEIINAFYGSSPTAAYFIGCSTGGRQALMEAQRYPADFKGIVAGDPANLQNYVAPLSQGYREVANRTTTPDHTMILRQQKVSIVANAVLAQCDALDGVTDGIVADPRACHFNIDSVACAAGAVDTSACLTPDEITVLRKWYDSPRTTAGAELFPGGEPAGSENGWNLYAMGTDANLSFGGMFGDQDLKFLAFDTNPPPTYGIYTFNYDTDKPLLDKWSKVYNSDNPDMRAFRDLGGKLILYHGFADPLITPFQTIQYYEDGVQRMGGDLAAVQSWYRLFLLPGVYHCSGGPGPSTIDFYSAINAWSKNGTPPASLLASSSTMTRPVYPYPSLAHFAGVGDPNKPESWSPVTGPRGRSIGVLGLAKYPSAPAAAQQPAASATVAAVGGTPTTGTPGPRRGALILLLLIGAAASGFFVLRKATLA